MGKWVYRRPHFRRRRPPPVFGVTAAVAAAGQVLVRLLRPKRRRKPARRARPSVVGTAPRPPGFAGPIIRFRRAVESIRRAMQRRLRWRPRLEIEPPAVPRVVSTPKGRIFTPGGVRGRIEEC